jgi:hypothetical protein
MMNPDVGLRSNPAAYPALDTEVRVDRGVLHDVDVRKGNGALNRGAG